VPRRVGTRRLYIIIILYTLHTHAGGRAHGWGFIIISFSFVFIFSSPLAMIIIIIIIIIITSVCFVGTAAGYSKNSRTRSGNRRKNKRARNGVPSSASLRTGERAGAKKATDDDNNNNGRRALRRWRCVRALRRRRRRCEAGIGRSCCACARAPVDDVTAAPLHRRPYVV